MAAYRNEALAEKAKETVAFFNDEFASETVNSINNSVAYRGESIPDVRIDGPTTKYVFQVGGTSDAIFDCFPSWIMGDKVCALNFASYRHPGGGFMKGCMAQEEALCHESNLYSILSNNKFTEEYNYNNAHQNNGLYEDFAIYSPDVVFVTPDRLVDARCDIITCPAPNWREANKHGVSETDNRTALYNRIETIVKVAKANDVKILIIGAFGCGVFKQNCETAAMLFNEILKKYHFDKVVVAIPEEEKLNIFKKYMNNESN